MKPISIFGLWITGIFGAALLGFVTNAINAQVSELYFRTILHWHDVANIQRAIIAQGVFEGLICGLILSTLLTGVIAVVSNVQCSYLLGMRYIVSLLVATLICWAVGGTLAVGLVTLSPEFYHAHFIGVPQDASEQLRYAWVGGSIWGIQFGGTAATLLFMTLFRAKWRSLN